MGYIKRKVTTKARVAFTQSEFEVAKRRYLNRIKKAVTRGKIPPELVINWDQTGVNVVPSSQWTQEERGSSRVEVAGAGDECHITVTVGQNSSWLPHSQRMH